MSANMKLKGGVDVTGGGGGRGRWFVSSVKSVKGRGSGFGVMALGKKTKPGGGGMVVEEEEREVKSESKGREESRTSWLEVDVRRERRLTLENIELKVEMSSEEHSPADAAALLARKLS